MPYIIKKVNNNCYAVINVLTGKIHSKCSSKKNAIAQIRLLSMLHFME